MRIGIISDTHGSLPPSVLKALEGCEHIIHAGDIGGQHLLDELETIAPVTAVLGNCDYFGSYLAVDEFASITLVGTRFFVAHDPADVDRALRGYGALKPSDPLPHICVHGHTHIPRNEQKGAALMLCPGSPSRPRGGSDPSVLILEAKDGGIQSLAFVPV
jgi:putative phosphoesterase